MNKIDDPIGEYHEQKKLAEGAEQAIQEFSWKPFVVENKGLIMTAKISQFILPFISVLTGIFFLVDVFGNLSGWMAVVIAMIAYSMLEFFKNGMVKNVFMNRYRDKTNYLSIIGTLLLVAVSIFSSVNGAAVFYQKQDKSQENLKEKFLKLETQLITKHDSIINKREFDKQFFVDNNQVFINNRIGTKFNHKLAPELTVYVDQINQAITNKEDALKNLNNKLIKEKVKATKKSQFNVGIFIAFSSIVELFIIGSVWFVVFARFMYAKEAQRIKKGKKISFSIPVLDKLLTVAGLDSLQDLEEFSFQPSQNASSIGSIFQDTSKTDEKSTSNQSNYFEVPSKTLARDAPIIAIKNTRYYRDYPKLCDHLIDIKTGNQQKIITDQLAERYAVSASTVYRVKACIFPLLEN